MKEKNLNYEEIEDLFNFINEVYNKNNNRYKLFRGQKEKWPLIPTAARSYMGNELYKRDFDKYAQKYKKISPLINNKKIARTFTNISFNLFPILKQYLKYNTPERDVAQFINQFLRQQYSELAFGLDVSSNIDVALFMSIHEFIEILDENDYRFITRVEKNLDGYSYLYVFYVSENNVLKFDGSNFKEFVKNGVKYYKKAQNIKGGLDVAVDMSEIKNAKRFYNQSSWFLIHFLENIYDHKIDNKYYNFKNSFQCKAYKVNRKIIDEYFEKKKSKFYGRINLFPYRDEVLKYVRKRENERKYAVENDCFGNTDLGCSINEYMPEIDNLFLPSVV